MINVILMSCMQPPILVLMATMPKSRSRNVCGAAERCTEQAPITRRAAGASTVRSVKHPLPAGKLPVRSLFRITGLIVATASATG